MLVRYRNDPDPMVRFVLARRLSYPMDLITVAYELDLELLRGWQTVRPRPSFPMRRCVLANAVERSKQDPRFTAAIDALLQQAALDAEERHVVESDRAGQTYAGT